MKTLLKKFHMLECKPMSTPTESGLQFSVSDPSPKVNATLY